MEHIFKWLISETLLLLEEIEFRSRMLVSRGACGEPRGKIFEALLLRLQENPAEASFLVACLARRIVR
jgi:hypothetical protein